MKSIKTEKIPELVSTCANEVGIEGGDIQKLIDRIKDVLPTEEESEEKAERTKQQYCVIVSSPTPVEVPAWVVTIPENESPATIEEKARKAAHDFNATKKGRLIPVNTLGETFENVPGKIFKQYGLTVKTKIAVITSTTDNSIGDAPSV